MLQKKKTTRKVTDGADRGEASTSRRQSGHGVVCSPPCAFLAPPRWARRTPALPSTFCMSCWLGTAQGVAGAAPRRRGLSKGALRGRRGYLGLTINTHRHPSQHAEDARGVHRGGLWVESLLLCHCPGGGAPRQGRSRRWQLHSQVRPKGARPRRRSPQQPHQRRCAASLGVVVEDTVLFEAE